MSEKLEDIARELLAAMIADYGDPDDYPGDEGGVSRSVPDGVNIVDSNVTFQHMRRLRAALEATDAASPFAPEDGT